MGGIHNKILLINPAGWQKESVNLGLAYLAGALGKAGYPVMILDLNRFEKSDSDLSRKVAEYCPRIIGISVKTATANEGARLANYLATTFPDALYVAGGPHVTLCADTFMKDYPVFSYGILGEGEETFVALAYAITNNLPPEDIRGLAYRQGGQIVINQWAPPDNLDGLALPDFDAIEDFSWSGFRYPIVTSRGCPFQCIYCCVNKLTGSRRWRHRSPENVVDELALISREKGIRLFEIWDDNFTLNMERAKKICRKLVDRNLELSWYCHNGIRADRIDTELADLMRQAGCTSIAFGIESGNSETFDSIKKGEPLSAVIRAIRLVKKSGIRTVGYFIIGLPGDTLEKFIESVKFQRSLKLDHYMFGMLIPYPKTEVWDIVHAQGKMLADITATQHFSHDIVPISFEMPQFPRNDMVRAFYMAKYFELFEAVRRAVEITLTPTVMYVLAPQHSEHLPGMILSCDPSVRHVIIGNSADDALRPQDLSQAQSDLTIEIKDTLTTEFSRTDGIVLVCSRSLVRPNMFTGNLGVIIVDPNPDRPQEVLVEVKKLVKPLPWVPLHVLGLIGLASALPSLARRYGLKKATNFLMNSAFPALMRRYGIIRVWSLIRRLVGLFWHVGSFAWTKLQLRLMRKIQKREFPFENHSSYM